MKCDELRSRLVEYLDDVVSEEERVEIDAHLQICSQCSRETEEHRRAWALLDLVPGFEDASRIEEEDALHLDRLRAIPDLEKRRLRLRVVRWASGVAAALVVGIVAFSWPKGDSPTPTEIDGSRTDDELIARLHFVMDLEFLDTYGLQLDAHRELSLLEALGEDG